MPTFSAIALDRLLEPGTSKSVDKSVAKSKPSESRPCPDSKMERKHSTSAAERKLKRPQITPALYATPKPTPLPDLPPSFTPSPYIINHKRRGPRLMKSYSQDDVSFHQKTEEKVNGKMENAETEVTHLTKDDSVTLTSPGANEEDLNGGHASGVGSFNSKIGSINGELESSNGKLGSRNGKLGSSNGKLGSSNGKHGSCNGELESSTGELGSMSKSNAVVKGDDVLKDERDLELENFFDPHDSLSIASNTDGEDNCGAERSVKLTPAGEFFDAWEELSSEGGPLPSVQDLEAELREMRMNVLLEIEKRKQLEEALNNMRSQWQRLREQLSDVGLTLPAYPTVIPEAEQLDCDPTEELCQQVHVARLVSESIGKGVARAELEMEMEAEIQAKNFEIARLNDRLHFYEVVNREMYQRNQDALEVTRHERQRRKRRQRWVWGSIAAAIMLGTVALAWSYLPTGRGSSSTDHSPNPEGNDAAD